MGATGVRVGDWEEQPGKEMGEVVSGLLGDRLLPLLGREDEVSEVEG